ncbi:Endoplasmic reticulum resident protein 44 [Halotydeus destructor]|nr:Endoplasmic reticulum resident protein 44 [Halotydeus destructor]
MAITSSRICSTFIILVTCSALTIIHCQIRDEQLEAHSHNQSQIIESNVTNQVVEVNRNNFEHYLNGSDLFLILFYVDWCPFSVELKPIFKDAAFAAQNQSNQGLIFGQVNCEVEETICNTLQVKKFPVVKAYVYETLSPTEYRGERTVEAIMDYVQDILTDRIVRISDLPDSFMTGQNQSLIVRKTDIAAKLSELRVFRAAASLLHDRCTFVWLRNIANERDGIEFLPIKGEAESIQFRHFSWFDGDMMQADELLRWASDRCIPVMRKLTFKNAEEIVDEGRPIAVLLMHLNDTQSLELYENILLDELHIEARRVSFTYTDATKWTYPLSKFNKTQQDLPVLIFDDLSHMYLYKNFEDIKQPGHLKRFVADLTSGRLHEEYHKEWFNAVAQALMMIPLKIEDEDDDSDDDADEDALQALDMPKANITTKVTTHKTSTTTIQPAFGLPESSLKKLGPSEKRYTLIKRFSHDEL